MRFPPKLLWTVSVLVWMAGCDCGGTIGQPCESNADCNTNEQCVDGRCASRGDAGPRRDGGGCVDVDGDAICASDDCDDNDPMRGGGEQCDEVDNDCDGNVDEGIAEICRDCTPGCVPHAIPGPGGWMPTDENSDGVIVDEDGALTLGQSEVRAFAIWVANSDEGTVSKLDSTTARELARYPSVGSMAPAGVPAWGAANSPSRTAVDQNFDAYVGNRAFGSQGSVTKYANREADCIDRNANGVIDTSRDINGNGTIEMGTPEFVGPDDECILWTTAVGVATKPGDQAGPRALSLGLAPPDGLVGDVWVGLWYEQQACRLDYATGAVLACIATPGFMSYGFAGDASGRIWAVDRSATVRDILGYIDPIAMTFQRVGARPGAECTVPYGVTVDGNGDVFMANDCPPQVWRYRPSTGEWTPLTLSGTGTPRGVAADESSLWVALSHTGDSWGGSDQGNRIVRFNLSDLSFAGEYFMPTGRRPIGIGVSFDGSVWAINQYNNIASRLDPVANTWIEQTVGLGPYTYSDFIGFGLNVFAEPRGHYAFVVEGCEAPDVNRWTGARYVAEVPPGTSVTLYVRVADTREALAALPWIGPFEGNPVSFDNAPGPLPTGRYIEVDIRLATMDRMAAPRVFSIDVAGICEESLM